MVKIRILGDRKNKVNGFYLLMTNYSMNSYKLDRYYVNGPRKEVLKLLKKNKIKFREVSI